MALLIRGKTRSKLCNRVIEEGQEALAFAPFVPNEVDPIHVFHDAAVHLDCFSRHPLADAAERRQQEVLQALDERICEVCGQEITDPSDYIGIGYLTDDPKDPLYRFSLRHVHRSHAASWVHRQELYSGLAEQVRAGRLKGDYYDVLLRELVS
jgi:hypothetical protein